MKSESPSDFQKVFCKKDQRDGAENYISEKSILKGMLLI